MVVRRADPAEAPLLSQIVERAYAVYVERIGRRPAPMDDDYEAKTRRGEVFVADDGAVAGLIVLVERPDHLLVENVAVDPARRGTGVGRALLEYAESHAAARGLRELRLYTNEAMTENLAFYPRLGYCEVGRRVEDGFRRVYYSKRVPTLAARWRGKQGKS
ncbi:MAG TPA: GNAT family N-acetyltransferase [Gaiellaceae bacterium]|nr:GNAT family N-acetyltransferase [Gaiellaceae bacterium]